MAAFSEISFHHRLARPGTIVDVGANIGTFSSHFSVWEHNKLEAFEPFPPTFDQLKRNLTEGHKGFIPARVKLHMAALGDRMGVAKMRVPKVGNGLVHEWASLAKSFEGDEMDDIRYHEVEVPVWTLDGMGVRDLTAIKIDAEGYEQEVIMGARNTISSCRPIISCELEERHRQGSTWAIPAFLSALDYNCYYFYKEQFFPISRLDRSTMQVASKSPANREYSDPYIYEFYFVPRERYDLYIKLREFGTIDL